MDLLADLTDAQREAVTHTTVRFWYWPVPAPARRASSPVESLACSRSGFRPIRSWR